MTHSTSNRDRIGSGKLTLSANVRDTSYLPPSGFAAAITAQRACSWVTIPALEMEIVCCSMASWIDTRSLSFILSNSSIKQTPLSASTKPPPSSTHSRVTGSLCTPAVSPTADAPLPVVYTARFAVVSTYLRNWDLATPGSPSSSTLMSPRRRWVPSALRCPPNKANAMACLTFSWPWMDGAILLINRRAMCGSRERDKISWRSSSVKRFEANRSARLTTLRRYNIRRSSSSSSSSSSYVGCSSYIYIHMRERERERENERCIYICRSMLKVRRVQLGARGG